MIKLVKAIRLAVLATLVSGSVATAAGVKILKAGYGLLISRKYKRLEIQGKDVTDKVKDLISKGKEGIDSVTMNELFDGDPAPGQRKELRIVFLDRWRNRHRKTFQEGEMGELQKWILEQHGK